MSGRATSRGRRAGGDPVLHLRRFVAHIFRRQSAAAWAFAILIGALYVWSRYWTLGADWQDPIQQVLLILFSLAIGAIVLPELPSALWQIDVNRVRNLVPQDKRDRLIETLVRAESDEEAWNEVVLEQALHPLFAASRQPWRYVEDMDYDVMLTLNRAVPGMSFRAHELVVENKAYRMFDPAEPQVWVSIARTEAALHAEFRAPGCLAREVVPLGGLTGDAWVPAATEHCRVALSIDGTELRWDGDEARGAEQLEIDTSIPDVVRWRTPRSRPLPTGRVRVHVRYDALLDVSERTFPVFFTGYYCVGTTEIAMRLHDQEEPSDLSCDFFVARALGEEPPEQPAIEHHSMYQRAAFSTGRPTILWPGSGVRFDWKPRAVGEAAHR